MNKSIILVMCDMLILSAMSLSNGGFSAKAEDYQNYVPVVEKERFDELATRLKEKEEEVRKAKDAIEKANAETEAERQAVKDAKTAKEQAEAKASSAKEAEKQAKQDAEAARASEAQAEAVAATALKNEAVANAKAAEAQKREADAKSAEQIAREAERVAKTQAEEAAAKAETARQNEAVAKAKAAEAQKREEDAKAAEKAAREAEALAKNQAEEAAAQEARAKADAETARANEAHAKAEAEMARKNEMVANELAHEAQQREEQAKAELAEIRVRQKALVGDIPRNISWEMAIHTIHTTKRNKKPKTRFSPLIASPSGCFLFVEFPKIDDVKSYADIVSIVATHDTLSVTGELFRVEGHDDWLFVKIRDSFDMPHIGFGVESIGLDDNIVYYPDNQGKCSGNAVPCAIDNDGHFTCSVKTETRTIGQRIVGEGHSVYDGCFLLSTTRGSLGAIVRGDNPLVAERKCEVISPFLETDLVRIK